MTNQLQVIAATPPPPPELNNDAKWKWDHTWPRLDHNRFVYERDVDVLMLYCNAYATWREATRKLDSMGPLVKDERNRVVANPFVAIRDTAEERISDLAAQLGLRPDLPAVIITNWKKDVLPYLGLMPEEDE